MSEPKTKLTTAYVKLKFDDVIHAITNIRTFANGEKLYFLDDGSVYSAKDLEFNQPIPESDIRISVAHLREILEELASVRGVVNESVDEIINRVKKEI
ncbi:hypothetical protein [uncultured Muribaculum sp.]|uniref:hypothetical protein n=1 Tax=uncultured Muribaculum sp. TaxID=1918613 RepID=UPI0025B790AB|nr:hypothetical protein [uncultured Muribaculum sp.]